MILARIVTRNENGGDLQRTKNLSPIKTRKKGAKSMRALIVYGTTFGATRGTSEEIARILQEHSLDAKVVNAKEEKVTDISAFDLIVIGSGLANCKWSNDAEDFLKNNHQELENKNVAIFVSSVKSIAEREGNTAEIAKLRKAGLEDKVLKYNLKPLATGLFGGILNFNKMGFLSRKGMEVAYRSRLESTGFKETQPGVYDLRDWKEIELWAKELVQLTLNAKKK